VTSAVFKQVRVHLHRRNIVGGWNLLRVFLFSIFFCLPVQVPANEKTTVASINLCADQMLLLLAEDDQIVSLTNLSHQEEGSYYFEKARDFPVNEGHAEQVLNLRPDVVIVGQYSSRHTVATLRDAGLTVHTLPIANTVEMMFENIESVASWVGVAARGTQMVSYLREKLSWLAPAENPRPMAAVFDPNGFTSGAATLRGEMIEIAGFRNAATEAGIESFGKLSLETMINLNPDALIKSPYSPNTWSRAQAMSRHPALSIAGIDPQVISVPSRMTVCAGPWTLDVIAELHAARVALSESSE